jgi:hypothetical protein
MADSIVETRQIARAGFLVERYGLCECSFEITYDGAVLHHRQVAAAIACGPFRIPWPAWLAPQVAARAESQGDAVKFRVEIVAPFIGTVIVYEGSVAPEAPA